MHTERMYSNDREYKKFSDEWFIQLYFIYGSVERVMQHFWQKAELLPISPAGYHRLVSSRGIVKSVGRKDANMAETVRFFTHKAMEPALPLAKIYREYMPHSFETSLVTLHRIYRRIKDQDIKRSATALLISPIEDPNQILIAQEKTTSFRYAKFEGDATIPMTFCKPDEDPRISILRVLQQEVWTDAAVRGDLYPKSPLVTNVIPLSPVPLFFIDILDVRVAVFKLALEKEYLELESSSMKVGNHCFTDINNLESDIHFRLGVDEMVANYKMLVNAEVSSPIQYASYFNFVLCSASD